MINNELDKALKELELQKFPVTVLSQLKSGKEAQVFVVSAIDKKNYALKVYKDYKTRAFNTQKHYIEDRYIGDGANIRRAIKKGNNIGRQFIQDTWVMREQYFLKNISSETDMVPQYIRGVSNGVLMEFIGDENGAAPCLSDVKLDSEYWEETKDNLLYLIDLFLQHGIIHGDLSPFNILWWENRPIVIDFPQAVDVRETKRAYNLLRRDIKNTMKIFHVSEEEIDDLTEGYIERFRLI